MEYFLIGAGIVIVILAIVIWLVLRNLGDALWNIFADMFVVR